MYTQREHIHIAFRLNKHGPSYPMICDDYQMIRQMSAFWKHAE